MPACCVQERAAALEAAVESLKLQLAEAQKGLDGKDRLLMVRVWKCSPCVPSVLCAPAFTAPAAAALACMAAAPPTGQAWLGSLAVAEGRQSGGRAWELRVGDRGWAPALASIMGPEHWS